ncbi:MAG: mannitol dehydrogenase [bacterium]|jgi:mannitol-1-phosphate 5-dehydrogenase|nr:mannitol dehydrogenase [bacterium]MDD3806204.1 mannitol dehydrogenase [bacterium]MDD4152132.1 mannitol dehydrogenase [bacterium]MDD4558860.1 mannitol dehydrogenase [bacterium]
MKKAVIFGAGNIGRGFVAQLLYESGYETVFIDVNQELIRLLNERGSYEIEIISEENYRVLVGNIRAVDGHQVEEAAAEIAGAALVVTAVGGGALRHIAPTLATGIARRHAAGVQTPLNVVLCENLYDAGKIMHGYVQDALPPALFNYAGEQVAFVETVVARMVPVMEESFNNSDPLLMVVEPYKILPLDAAAWKGERLRIEGFLFCDNFIAYVERKLFIHNAGHALSAYEGYIKGYRFIYEAVEDEDIHRRVYGALREARLALEKKHGLDRLGLQENIDDLLRRFGSRKLRDTVLRVGRDPYRKLASRDRLVGAARMAEECGIKPRYIAGGIAAALCFAHPSDPSAVALQQEIADKGIGAVIESLCLIKPGELLYSMIMNRYEEFKGCNI